MRMRDSNVVAIIQGLIYHIDILNSGVDIIPGTVRANLTGHNAL